VLTMKSTRDSPAGKKSSPKIDILYLVCAAWFFFQFALVLISFFKVEVDNRCFITRAFIFGFLLLFYWIRNLFARLKGKLIKRKKGHIFVGVWLIFVLVLLSISLLSRGKYKLPFSALENLIYILSIFFGRNISKIILRAKRNGKRYFKTYVIMVFFGKRVAAYYHQWSKRNKKAKRSRKEKKKIKIFNLEGIGHAPSIKF